MPTADFALFCNAETHDHISCVATPESVSSLELRGYYSVCTLGRVLTAQVEGTVGLHQYFNTTIHDHFLSTSQPEGDGRDGSSGYQYVAPEAYAYLAPGQGTVPLRAYWLPEQSDHASCCDVTVLGLADDTAVHDLGVQCHILSAKDPSESQWEGSSASG
eukprot:gene272-11102_t